MLLALKEWNGDFPEMAAFELKKVAGLLTKLHFPTHQLALHMSIIRLQST